MRARLPLHPDVRDLYGASLRPPPGTVFDAAIATSYSLEFETALAIPVTLALFASESRDELLKNPLALLEGLERNADRLAIFCEAGRIQAASRPQSRLCTLLEKTIIEVTAPNGGAFHPKIWVLRYRPFESDGATRMRLLILSRNLTRDRSWDLSLNLDGVVGRGRRALNNPLVTLVRRLPSLSVAPMSDHVSPLLDSVLEDLQRTDWTVPDGFETVSFAVNGLGNRLWTPPSCNRMAVISPFCDHDSLEMLANLPNREEPTLVSRPEELISIPSETLKRFSEISVLDELAENEDGEGDDHDDDVERPASGLHAKAYLQEIGWNTVITVGSGNATRPSLISGRNVEVFATLTGKRSSVGGITEILGTTGLGQVLRAFHEAEVPQPDSDQRAAEDRVEEARRELANAKLHLWCEFEPEAGKDQPLWRLRINSTDPLELTGVSIARSWPITRGESHARDVLAALRSGGAVDMGTMALVDITRFIGFRLVDKSNKAQGLFTLGLKLDGDLGERHRAVLKWVIDSREAFLRYLRLLLADLSDPLSAQFAAGQAIGAADWGKGFVEDAILEDMVRALSRGRDRLRAVQRLLDRLDETSTEDAVVPEDFAELWAAFRTVLNERTRSRV